MVNHTLIIYKAVNEEDETIERVCLGGGHNQYTLCGITEDGQDKSISSTQLTQRPITCSQCISLIKICKGVKPTEITKGKQID